MFRKIKKNNSFKTKKLEDNLSIELINKTFLLTYYMLYVQKVYKY